MAAIDPDNCQLVEVPMDSNQGYVVHDQTAVIGGGQLQLSGLASTGKSLLKPELAQHLIQPVGLRAAVEPRGLQTAHRGGRLPTRKPLSASQGMQMMQGQQIIHQSAALAPTASGLLSLGTRYTPSSGVSIAPGGGMSAGGILTGSQGSIFASAGTTMVTTTGSVADRDAGYRLAAAMTGAGSRGRPRGRRPLRGQFPVVPIDMVRQLGIEQQVILQPAAPVAMRNRAVLCRPLSVSRKTQSCVQGRDVECQFNADEEQLASKEIEDEDEMMVVEEAVVMEGSSKKLHEDDEDLVGLSEKEEEEDNEEDDEDSDVGKKKTKSGVARRSTEFGANTDTLNTSHFGTQTETKAIKSEDKDNSPSVETTDKATEGSEEKIRYVPIPIPIPIYLPVPVYIYAKPVPCAVPFPLPCLVPFPLVLKGNEFGGSIVDAEKEKNETKKETTKTAQSAIEAAPKSTGSQKRPARDSLISTPASSIGNASIGPQQQSPALPSKRPRRSPERATPHPPPQPLVTTRRAPTTISDANYHLKFSYGINAWRHWVNHTGQPRIFADLLDVADEELNTALTRFVHEVRKPNNETYVADSIFYLCLGIQEYLNENSRVVNLFGDPLFTTFARALDTVLSDFQPRISPEGLLICRIEEEHLWEARQLGSDTPHIMLFSLLYFITKHLWLRTGDQHAQLKFNNFQSKREPNSETIFFMPTGGTESYVMFVSSEQANRCPVHLYRTYIKRCPPSAVNEDGPMYLNPLVEKSATTWFSDAPVPVADLQVMFNRIKMVKEIQEAFMDSQAE